MIAAIVKEVASWMTQASWLGWVHAALVAALVCAGIPVVVSAYLRRTTGRTTFTLWMGGWAFYLISLITLLALHDMPWDQVLQLICQVSTGISCLFIALSGLQLADLRDDRRILLGGSLLVMVAGYVGTYIWPVSYWITMAELALLGLAAVYVGRGFLQQPSEATRLLARAFMLWGGSVFLLPLLAQWPMTKTIGYVCSAILTLVVVIGMVVMGEAELFERTYRNVFDASFSGVFIVNLETLRILDANRMAQRLVKYSLAELLHMKITELYPDLRDTKDNIVDRRAMLGALFRPNNEVLVAKKDETMILCEGDTHVIQWRDRPALQINIREVAPEKSVGQVMRRAEKMSSLGQLVASVAHELNNPLAVMVAYAQLMIKQEQTDVKTRTMLQKIAHESERAAKIVCDLLAFARPCQPQMKQVNVNELVANVFGVRDGELRAQNVQCDVQLAPDLPPTKADPIQIEQVLNNLITNALHAMSEQTTERRISVSTETTGFHIRISVTDTGHGIPPTVIDKIFDPFFTTKPAGKGTGLGLSISNTIMQEHRGKLWVQSEPGHGAKFFVELLIVPCEEEKKEAPPPGAMMTAAESDRKPRILVVDDEDGIREVLTEIFVADGYDVDSVGNGKDALEQIGSKPYDLLISDVGMPGMGGEALYHRVAADYPVLARRMVFLTGDTINPKTRAFIEKTGNHWIGKPFNVSEIEDVVRGIVRPDRSGILTDTSADRVQRRYRSPGM